MTDFSTASAGALSPAVLDLQRRLLREVVRRNDTVHVTGEVLPDPDQGPAQSFTDEDTEIRATATTPSGSPLQAAFANRQFHQPVAEQLAPEELAALIERGDDPWAAGLDTSGPMEDVPIGDLLAACSLVRSHGSDGTVDGLLVPGAITLIPMRSSTQRDALHNALEDIVPTFLHLTGRSGVKPSLAVLRMDDPVTSDRRDNQIIAQREIERRRQDFDDAVAKNTPMLVLASGAEALPDIARRLPVQILPWPELTTDDVIEVLRATHSHTGCLAEDTIRAALPPAVRAATLAPILWRRALMEDSPIRAAWRLADLCAEGPGSNGLTLEDLHGQPSVRAELETLVSDVEAWQAGRLDWSDVTSSFLLCGPPGVGKTMTAAALAGSADLHFVATSYGACQAAGHLGDYLKAMGARVDEAIEQAPSVFFLDELDSFPRRDGGDRHGSRYSVSVVNAMLTDLSRLSDAPGVIVVGATNYPDRVDPALVRSGRFDRHLRLGLPDRTGVTAILTGHLGSQSPTVDIRPIAEQLFGCTGADIAAVVRGARGFARHRDAPLCQTDLEAAAERVAPKQTAATLWETAVHEAGHIVVSAALGLAPPRGARITARGGEVEVDLPKRMTRDALDRRMAAVLAGRAAEDLILGSIGHAAGYGDGSDLEVATAIALKIETEWGLADHLIYAPIPPHERMRLPEGLRRRVERHLSTAARRASDVLVHHEGALIDVARTLQLERELDADRIADLTRSLRRACEDGVSAAPACTLH